MKSDLAFESNGNAAAWHVALYFSKAPARNRSLPVNQAKTEQRAFQAAGSIYTAGVHCDVTGQLQARPTGGVWYFMHALGRNALPPRAEVAGRSLRAVRFVKHDFFAATGFYEDVENGETVVLKVSRTEPLLGLPMRWLGRRICERELRFYARLADLPNVPAVIGRFGATGFAHAYVPGRPLQSGLAIPDGFFDTLLALLEACARRGVAVVDTNKPENILLGDDGQPHLIDFQISFSPHDFFGVWPARALLRMLTRTDRYHVLKHKLRLRPDEMTSEESAVARRRPWPIRLHRRVTRPYFLLRRRLFAHLRASGRLMPEGSK